MKKLFAIICLCALQIGCASAPQNSAATNSLLTFDDLAGEISVAYEAIPEKAIDSIDEDEVLGTP